MTRFLIPLLTLSACAPYPCEEGASEPDYRALASAMQRLELNEYPCVGRLFTHLVDDEEAEYNMMGRRGEPGALLGATYACGDGWAVMVRDDEERAVTLEHEYVHALLRCLSNGDWGDTQHTASFWSGLL